MYLAIMSRNGLLSVADSDQIKPNTLLATKMLDASTVVYASFELIVIVGTEEGEGRDQRAGADAGHHLEFRPVALGGPAVENAGAERTGEPPPDKAR